MSEEKSVSVVTTTNDDHLSNLTSIRSNPKDVDEAFQYALNNEEQGIYLDEARSKRLLHKIDFYILPLVAILYSIQYMDKVSISIAAILGLRTDLAMEGDMYSWAGTIFYVGYLIFVFPASALLQRLPLAKTTAAFIFLWGVTLICHAACTNYAGFMTARIFLGILESAITPAMVIFTSQWYKTEEQFLRTSIWFSFNGLGTILSNAVGYGVVIREDSYSIRPWKLIFIITGSITILISILFVLHIPDNPSKAWFLTDEEKKLVVERIRSNEQGYGNKKFKKYQLKESLTDPVTWILFLYGTASCIPNGALTNFASILLNDDFGYTTIQTMLMGMPAGAVEIVGCIGIAWSVRFVKHRLLVSIITIAITLAAQCMLAFGTNKVALAGYYIQSIGAVAMICLLSLVASNTAGHTKKIVTNSIYLIGYCVGDIIGPQTFISSQAPKYVGGKISFVVTASASLLLLILLYFVYWKRNVNRAKLGEKVPEAQDNHEFADLTDKENPHFHYAL